MKNLDFIGLAKDQKVIDGLHQLLADYHIFFANLRGYHWNVKGPGFYALHEKFEAMYNGAAEVIDAIAERLLQLDEVPENKIDKLAAKAKLVAKGEPEDCSAMIEHVLEDMKYMTAQTRQLMELASQAGDDVTNDMLMGSLAEYEKSIWMLNAYRG